MNKENFIANHVKDLPRSGIRDFFAIVSEMPQAISLGIGEPDFVTPWKIREASIFALEQGRTSYTDNRGLISLRKEISKYCGSFFGIEYNPESEILVTVGVSEAIDIAFVRYLTLEIKFYIMSPVMYLTHPVFLWLMVKPFLWEQIQ